MRHRSPTRFASFVFIAIAVAVSVVSVAGCGDTIEPVEARAAQEVAAAHPEDPAAYLPDSLPGWDLEPVTQAGEGAPDGMRIAASLMVPEIPERGLAPVVLSAIVFDEGLAGGAAAFTLSMGESTREVEIEGETVWIVESEPQTCAAIWMAAEDTLVVTANASCARVSAAMAAVLAPEA
jgi:hypothetical protein